MKKSTFSIPADRRKIERDAFKAAGFSAHLGEGDDIVVTLRELLNMPIFKSIKASAGISSLGNLMMRGYKNGIKRCVLLGRRGVCDRCL